MEPYTVNDENQKMLFLGMQGKYGLMKNVFLNGYNRSIVDQFMNLGMLINNNGKFNDYTEKKFNDTQK